MTRLVLFLVAILGLSFGFSWLADNPGTITVDWQGYHAEPTVFQVVVLTAVLTALGICLWTILRQIWTSPAAVSHFLTKRRQQRGLDALSSGMIAIGAGDRATATRYALQARKSLPNEPLTHLLRAQAAQLSGDRATSRRIFEAMLSSPDTEQLGLRGLYLEASREGESEAQRQFAERAIALNPKLGWPVEGLFELQCKAGDWAAAIETLNLARRHGTLEKTVADRRRAVLLAGQAMALEDSQSEKALGLALEAHALAKDLVPAAAVAGRLLAAKGQTSKAAKVLQKTWARAPHPELAIAYAYARIGDSPRDRLDRVRQLAALNPHSSEGAIAVALASIEAHDFDLARDALSPLLEGRLTRRVATLMARIEKEQHGDRGRVREWLARAVNAPRDPAWTADGVVAESWAPASPVTGALDAFQWRVPVEEFDSSASVTGTSPLDDLMALESSGPGTSLDLDGEAASPVTTHQVAGKPGRETNGNRAGPTDGVRAGKRPVAAASAQSTPLVSRRSGIGDAEVVSGAARTHTGNRNLRDDGASLADSEGYSPDLEARYVDGEARYVDGDDDAGDREAVSPAGKAENSLIIEADPAGHAPGSAKRGTVEAATASRPDKNNRTSTAPAVPAKQTIPARGPAMVVAVAGQQASTGRMAAPQTAGSSASKRRSDAAVVVPLHAPDDPGTEPDDGDDSETVRPWPYRRS